MSGITIIKSGVRPQCLDSEWYYYNHCQRVWVHVYFFFRFIQEIREHLYMRMHHELIQKICMSAFNCVWLSYELSSLFEIHCIFPVSLCNGRCSVSHAHITKSMNQLKNVHTCLLKYNRMVGSPCDAVPPTTWILYI